MIKENDYNVVLIVCDTLRADRLGCYGYFRNTSPTIDKLASEGVLFEDFHTTGFSTGNTFTCIFTGLPGIKHKFYATPASAFNLTRLSTKIREIAQLRA